MKNKLKLSLDYAQQTLLDYTGYNQQTAIADAKLTIANKHKPLISDTCSIHQSFQQNLVDTSLMGAHQEPSKKLLTTISNYLQSNEAAINLIKAKLLNLGFNAEESNKEVINAYIFNFAYAFLCMRENKYLNADQEHKTNIQDLNIINTLQAMNPETVAQISILSANVLSPLLFVINSKMLISTLKPSIIGDETFLEEKSTAPTSYIEINVTNSSIDISIETNDSMYEATFKINLDAHRKKATILSSNLQLPQEFLSKIDIQDYILTAPDKRGSTAFALTLDTEHYLDDMEEKIYNFFEENKHFEDWIYDNSHEFNKDQNPFNKKVFSTKIMAFKVLLIKHNCHNNNFTSGNYCDAQNNTHNVILTEAADIDLYNYMKKFRTYAQNFLNQPTWDTNYLGESHQDIKINENQTTQQQEQADILSSAEHDFATNLFNR